MVLPSLWEAISGSREVNWAVVDENGRNVFTPEMARCWAWKDELPERGLVCVGKHLGRWAALVAPRMLPALYALTGRPGRADDFRGLDLTPVQRDVAEAVLEEGPATPAELRARTGAEKKSVDAAVIVLQRALVLTNAKLVTQDKGWGAIAVDVLPRRWPLGPLPAAEDARLTLTSVVLASSGELSAADLGGALGWRLKASRETLEELVGRGEAHVREADGLPLFSA